MSDSPIPTEILNLSPADRIALATRIWESVAKDASLGLSDEHKRIIDQRIAEADANPDSLIPTEEVFKDLLADR